MPVAQSFQVLKWKTIQRVSVGLSNHHPAILRNTSSWDTFPKCNPVGRHPPRLRRQSASNTDCVIFEITLWLDFLICKIEIISGPTLQCLLFVSLDFLAVPRGQCNLSSPTRDRTHTLCGGNAES